MKPLVFSKKAEEDLEQIADYIAQDNRARARALSFVREQRRHCQHMGQFPESHRRFPELGLEARIMPFGNYVVLYRVLDHEVSIERILHGARDILALLDHRLFRR